MGHWSKGHLRLRESGSDTGEGETIRRSISTLTPTLSRLRERELMIFSWLVGAEAIMRNYYLGFLMASG
jgi:hypothetical protein